MKNQFLLGIFCWFLKEFEVLKGLNQLRLHYLLNLSLQIDLKRSLLIILNFNFLAKVFKLHEKDCFFPTSPFKVFHLFRLFLIQVFLNKSFYVDENEQLTLDFKDVYELSCIQWGLKDKNINHFYQLFHLKDIVFFYWLICLYYRSKNFH